MNGERTMLRYAGIAVLAIGAVGLVLWLRDSSPSTPSVVIPQAVAVPRQLGTPHPIFVLEVGHEGRWVAACQARSDTDGDGRISVRQVADHGWPGDSMSLYLFRDGVGDGEVIDQWLGGSRDGRWVLVVRDGALVAIDTEHGGERAFPDAAWPKLARLADQRVLYLRGADARQLVIYDLAQQREQVVQTRRQIGAISTERGEAWAIVYFARTPMTAHNQQVIQQCRPIHDWDGWPYGYSNLRGKAWVDLAAGRIDEPAGRGSVSASQRWAVDDSPMAGATIAHVDGRAISRAADGSWQWGATTIVPADCSGVPEALVAQPFRLIVACRGRESLDMFGPALRVTLPGSHARWADDAQLALLDENVHREPDTRFVCISPDCFSLADGRRVGPEVALASDGPYVIGRYGNRYDVTDSRTGVMTQLEPVVSPQTPRDRIIAVDDRLLVDVSMSPPRAVRVIDRAVAAIDDRGWMLIGEPPPRQLGHTDGPMMVGPLTWTRP